MRESHYGDNYDDKRSNQPACLIARSLQTVFDITEHQTQELQPFFNNSKYELYQIITGPKWDLDISYDERKKRKEDNVRAYMVDATDKIATFRDMLKLLIKSNAIKDSDSYEIADGINIALQSLSDNREAYITCAKMILASEVTTGIGIMVIRRRFASCSCWAGRAASPLVRPV